MTRAALAALAVAAVVALGAAPASAVTFTDGPNAFESVGVAGGIPKPTAVTWAKDGRMFIAQKQGYVRVVSPTGHLLSNVILDIHDHVANNHDRGLLGIAAEQTANPGDPLKLYLLYTKGSPTLGDEEAAVSTLTRVTVNADNTVAGGGVVNPPETDILGSVDAAPCPDPTADCISSTGYTHSIGTVRVDPNDGTLWVGSGDGENDDVARAEALDAQDEDTLTGKILHIAPSGQGLPGHPFCDPGLGLDDLNANCAKVYAKGFRNPFRFTLRQVSGSSRPVSGDVGWGHWEEINEVTPGMNAGWPCWEADE